MALWGIPAGVGGDGAERMARTNKDTVQQCLDIPSGKHPSISLDWGGNAIEL